MLVRHVLHLLHGKKQGGVDGRRLPGVEGLRALCLGSELHRHVQFFALTEREVAHFLHHDLTKTNIRTLAHVYNEQSKREIIRRQQLLRRSMRGQGDPNGGVLHTRKPCPQQPNTIGKDIVRSNTPGILKYPTYTCYILLFLLEASTCYCCWFAWLYPTLVIGENPPPEPFPATTLDKYTEDNINNSHLSWCKPVITEGTHHEPTAGYSTHNTLLSIPFIFHVFCSTFCVAFHCYFTIFYSFTTYSLFIHSF